MLHSLNHFFTQPLLCSSSLCYTHPTVVTSTQPLLNQSNHCYIRSTIVASTQPTDTISFRTDDDTAAAADPDAADDDNSDDANANDDGGGDGNFLTTTMSPDPLQDPQRLRLHFRERGPHPERAWQPLRQGPLQVRTHARASSAGEGGDPRETRSAQGGGPALQYHESIQETGGLFSMFQCLLYDILLMRIV